METPRPRHLCLNPWTKGDVTSLGTRTWWVGLRRGSCSVEAGRCTSWLKGRQGKAGLRGRRGCRCCAVQFGPQGPATRAGKRGSPEVALLPLEPSTASTDPQLLTGRHRADGVLSCEACDQPELLSSGRAVTLGPGQLQGECRVRGRSPSQDPAACLAAQG